MTEINSTVAPAPRKPRKADPPKKPHKDFPLFPNGNGQWCKKVLGRPHYFGKWQDDPKGIRALDRWLAEKDDLLAGRVPRGRKTEAAVLHFLCNSFLNAKRALRDGGELSPYTWDSYEAICRELTAAFGRDRLLTDILPEDFEKLRETWAAKWGPVRLGSEINRARVVFNYGYKNGLLDKPMRYGEGFKRPSKKTLRLNKAAAGPKMFEADELRAMIDAATQPMKAMLLLAINAGLGNHDIAMLPESALDLKAGWMTYPRRKTGINRRCPLWPETIKALQGWLVDRPAPADEANAGLVFLTVRGNSWAKDSADRPITHECRKLLNKLKINGSRNFYAIRHSFETIGGDSRDQVAVNAIMGHDDGSMASTYRERIEDDRLQAVVAHVRAWLFDKKKKNAAPKRLGIK
ncbi:MAG TPA: tyrosine-type recombinase/integrase [Gemmataceae bacterium]|nr:tyrosine-type recombinase/integrase [Gemmataceae bacterium]